MIKQVYIFCLLAFVSTALAHAQSDKPAYILYDKNEEEISYQKVVERSHQNDLILFGEMHDNPIAHWLQLELIRDLSADSSKPTMVGMEMFEADQQILIDEYFNGQISQNSFESEARLWDNYKTDYKPIVEFARENNLPLIATNIPRRYASAVYGNGLSALDSLSSSVKEWMAPLPLEVDTTLQSYQNMSELAEGHGGENLIYSQASKDATMAHFILQNLKTNCTMVHLNGSYHSNDYEGIVWFIRQEKQNLNILTINTVTVDDVENVEASLLQSADVTLVVPSRMTKTY